MRSIGAAVVAAGILLSPIAALADDETPPVVGGRTYVQHQIELAKASHPEILSILVTGTPGEHKPPVVFGSTEDVGQVLSPAPTMAPDGAGVEQGRYIVREPFLSSTKHRLGTIAIAFSAKAAPARNQLVAGKVQAAMARATLSAKNAADPYPFDPAWGPDRYAQQLTEKTLARHPDLLVMMIHATPPGGAHNLIVGSNIGRFGKIADDDDLRVIEKGSTNLEIGGDNDRFETELPLDDASGKRIGALGLVFPYRPGDDKEAIHRHGLAIRDEVAAAIPNSPALFRRTR